MPKVRVKVLDSIAGLADPDTAKLEAKYDKIIAGLRGREKPPSEQQIRVHIEGLKKADRYHEKPIGFKKDWSFKQGDEVMVEKTLAEKWVEAEICLLIEEKKAA